MRPTSLLLLLLLVSLTTLASARKNALKTKKYKCIEIMDDEEALVSRNFGGWSKADEELRPIGSARLGAPTPPTPVFPPPQTQMERPRGGGRVEEQRARVEEYTEQSPVLKAPSSFISPMQAPRDSKGNPLVLSPQHCNQVKHYAGMYGVRDVLTWVKGNCAFAKMYLPSATCEEINILIASCYPKSAPATPRPRPTTTTAAPAPAQGGQSLFGGWKPWFW